MGASHPIAQPDRHGSWNVDLYILHDTATEDL